MKINEIEQLNEGWASLLRKLFGRKPSTKVSASEPVISKSDVDVGGTKDLPADHDIRNVYKDIDYNKLC